MRAEQQYLDILKELLDKDTFVQSPAREKMPATRELFVRQIRVDLKKEFPLLTTKKLSIKNIFYELLWFLRGDTCIKYLVDKGCNIWNADAYKYYKKIHKNANLSMEEFVQGIKAGLPLGSCGKIYGYQWRGRKVDQIQSLIDGIKTNKASRYHILCSWSPDEMIPRTDVALPACHCFAQFIVQGNKINCFVYQRSCDFFLGVPYNVASYAILTHLLASLLDLEVGELVWEGGSVHLYENHTEQAKLQLSREMLEAPTLDIPKVNSLKEILNLEIDDITLKYKSHGIIKAPLSVGV